MRRSTALLALTLLASMGLATGARAEVVGTTTAVQPEALQTPEGGAERALAAGDAISLYDLIATSASGLAQILFADESTLTVGPGSQVQVDEFVYDGAGSGTLALEMESGIARYLGGHISKEDDVTIDTPHGTIGIRGGMVLLQVAQETWAAHQFGILTCSGGGEQEVITKSGFACIVGPNGVEVVRVPEQQSQALLEIMAGLGGQEEEGVTGLIDLFCDSGFGENHKDCIAPPGGLAHTQGEDLGTPGEAVEETEIIDEQQDGDIPEIPIDDQEPDYEPPDTCEYNPDLCD